MGRTSNGKGHVGSHAKVTGVRVWRGGGIAKRAVMPEEEDLSAAGRILLIVLVWNVCCMMWEEKEADEMTMLRRTAVGAVGMMVAAVEIDG